MVIRDIKHRWNYTEAMLMRANILSKAIDQWVARQPSLRPLLLTPEDWKLLDDLRNILRVRLHLYHLFWS
ncbi:hypothetical protein K438DRAFT_1631643 [Mycena galopus ATCC 62051]|nr:hypothetical protein K438DRAFT_1631694 [Mycena galopus ATCC 62051]KAF8144566.1 hypothetical protein K438DRAFT_1631643 [Mycena galopus ATCC 62051]